jgi:hypothetical protein
MLFVSLGTRLSIFLKDSKEVDCSQSVYQQSSEIICPVLPCSHQRLAKILIESKKEEAISDSQRVLCHG